MRRKRYKKRYSKKGRGYHPYVRATAPAVAYVAMKTAERVVKKYVNTEYKHFDVDGLNLDMEAITGVQAIHLNPIPAGDSSEERDGDQVKITRVHVTGRVAGDGQRPNIVKVQLWLVVQGTALPAIGNLYDTTDSGGAAINVANMVSAKRQIQNTNKFVLLKTFKDVCGDVSASNRNHILDLYHEFPKGLINKYTEGDTTGTIANTTKGAIVLTYLSDQSTTDFPTLSFVSRVRYIDN